MKKHQELGNQWMKISRFLPGRTNLAIKNYWYLLRLHFTTQSLNYSIRNGHLKHKVDVQGPPQRSEEKSITKGLKRKQRETSSDVLDIVKKIRELKIGKL